MRSSTPALVCAQGGICTGPCARAPLLANKARGSRAESSAQQLAADAGSRAMRSKEDNLPGFKKSRPSLSNLSSSLSSSNDSDVEPSMKWLCTPRHRSKQETPARQGIPHQLASVSSKTQLPQNPTHGVRVLFARAYALANGLRGRHLYNTAGSLVSADDKRREKERRSAGSALTFAKRAGRRR